MRIGIVSSSGGSAFKSVKEIIDRLSHLKHTFFVVVDRECGIYSYCLQHGIEVKKIICASNKGFSQQAAKQFENWTNINVVFLFFTRLVTDDLFSKFRLINIHPSLLPEFKGFNAVEQALKAKSRVLGATAHIVDESMDGGHILVQTSKNISSDILNDVLKANKISYIQKIWLMLFLVDLLERENEDEHEDIFSPNAKHQKFPLLNPVMHNKHYADAILSLQESENITVFE